jgi:predicted acylesterase/phospholipase RssA
MVMGATGATTSATAVVTVAAGALVAVAATIVGATSVGATVGALVATGADVGASGVADTHAERINEKTINKETNEKNLFDLTILSPE